MDQNVIGWIAILIFALIGEGLSTQLVTIWFALGAAGGLITYEAGGNVFVQLVVFTIISAICIILLRPVAKRLIKNQPVSTNIDRLIGQNIIITEEVNNLKNTGTGIAEGKTWTIRSSDNTIIIPKGEVRICDRVEGVKLIVK